MVPFTRALILVVLAAVASASAAPAGGAHLRAGTAPAEEEAKPAPASEKLSPLRRAARAVVAEVTALARRRQPAVDSATRDLARGAEIKEVGSREAKSGEVPTHAEEVAVVNARDVVVGAVFWVVLAVLFAIYHEKTKVWPTTGTLELKGEEQKEFKDGFWTCCEEPRMCMLSFCCPAVRWGDTMRMAGLLTPFALAFAVFLSLSVLSSVFGMLLAFLLAIVGAKYRQDLRAKFAISPGTAETWCLDFLAYCCCPCVAITQEARTVEAAWGANHPAVQDVREAWEQAALPAPPE